MRTLIDVPEVQIEELDVYCSVKSISRAEGVRRAISHYLQYVEKPASLNNFFGIWHDKCIDGLKVQQDLRKEWS